MNKVERNFRLSTKVRFVNITDADDPQGTGKGSSVAPCGGSTRRGWSGLGGGGAGVRYLPENIYFYGQCPLGGGEVAVEYVASPRTLTILAREQRE